MSIEEICSTLLTTLPVQFLIRGVVYRLHGKDANDSDPLVEDRLDDLQRDLTLFQELGLNTLFIG